MKYKCGKCGRKGHNRVSCKNKKKVAKKKTIRRKKTTKKKTTKKAKKKTSRTMGRAEKVSRWGKIVARYKSKSSSKTYAVRRKGKSYSCNCPGWIFKKKGKGRYCRHVTMAKAGGKRSKRKSRRRKRSRFCRR